MITCLFNGIKLLWGECILSFIRNSSGRFLKHRENYEIINPNDLGIDKSSIDLTARSGRASLKHRLQLLGFEPSKLEMETIYTEFLNLADEKKLLHDEDLYTLMKSKMQSRKTLFDKVWDNHVVQTVKDGPSVLFIDRHLVHEVTSPVAFQGLENRGIPVLFPLKHLPQLIITLQLGISIFLYKILLRLINSKP